MSMRILAVHLENVRRYVEPVILENLGPGLNLITGPNGAGKSTWVRAIRAAFFAFHRSRQVGDLVPWSAPGASPRITVTFEIAGGQYQLSKQFFKGAFARLQTPDGVFEADAAETRVASLLGFEAVRKGEASQIGIPGLLWLEQGMGPDLGESKGPLAQAGDYLREALGQSAGEVASSSGDEVLQQLEADLAQLRTRRRDNAPRGILAEALDASEQARSLVSGLQVQINEHREKVDRLEQLRSERDRDRAEKPWEALQASADDAQRQLDSIRSTQRQIDQLKQEVGHLSARRSLVLRELERRRALLASIDERTRARDDAIRAVNDLQARQSQAHELAAQHQEQAESCRLELETARKAEQLDELLRRVKELQETHDQFSHTLDKAGECQQAIENLTTRLAGKNVDAKILDRLREIEQEQGLLVERLSAAGTEIRFDLVPGQSVMLDDEKLEGQGKRLLTEEQTLHLEGVGQISIRPGRIGLEPARKARQQLNQEHDNLLQQLGMSSLSQATQAFELGRKMSAEREIEQARLKALAPGGIEQLRLRVAGLHGELTRSREQAGELQSSLGQQAPRPTADLRQQLYAAQAALDMALEQSSRSAEAERVATEALSAAKVGLNHAEQELLSALQVRDADALEPASGSANAPGSANQDLDALDRQLAQQQADIAGLEQSFDSQLAETLALDVKRFAESARLAQEQARRRELDEASLAAELSQAGAAGLEEAHQRAEAELLRCEQRAQDLTLRADALAWLVQRIRSHRDAVTARLQAPLQQRMDHYLKLLLPGVEMTMSSGLAPDMLQARQPDSTGQSIPEAVGAQSFGTREQISLIARLAYADVLAEAGRATLLMIDDGMLNADGQRLERVKRILFDGAQRHQVLLFSCHPERWQGLGGSAQQVPGARD